MVAEEGTDALRAETVLPGSRKDDRIGQDDFPLVDAALEVAKDEVTTRNVVAEVAQGLHNLAPFSCVVIPSGVAVELLVVLDERLV
jgi:hypothetical protein